MFKYPPESAEIYLTKNPGDICRARPALTMMRTLYLIYLIRDPRDVVVSRHKQNPERYWIGLNAWRFFTAAWEAVKGHERLISIRYEDLVTDPDAVQQEIMKRMPFLKKKANFSEYHLIAKPSGKSLRALNDLRPISSASVGNWREHLPRIAGQIQRHGSMTADLIKYGYEENDEWEKVLDGVEPDLRDSHWAEVSKDKVRDRAITYYWKGAMAAVAHTKFRLLLFGWLKVRRVIRKSLRYVVRRFFRLLKWLGKKWCSPQELSEPLASTSRVTLRKLVIGPEQLAEGKWRNFNVPSVIRVPDWVENPLGRYYLYFASHERSDRIHLAYADHVEGPWREHPDGALDAKSVGQLANYAAGPDVHVDHELKQIRMYFQSCLMGQKLLRVFVATSNDGRGFEVGADVARTFYFRAFQHDGAWYGLSKGGRLYRSFDGQAAYERGPDVFPPIRFNGDSYNEPGSIRHLGVEVAGDQAMLYHSRIGDAPERILVSSMDLSGGWREWRAQAPREVIRPEFDWEGVNQPIKPSCFGKAEGPVHQLRDPEIFCDEDGSRYLFYAAAGENAIGLARLE